MHALQARKLSSVPAPRRGRKTLAGRCRPIPVVALAGLAAKKQRVDALELLQLREELANISHSAAQRRLPPSRRFVTSRRGSARVVSWRSTLRPP